jgi:hypothetical protein
MKALLASQAQAMQEQQKEFMKNFREQGERRMANFRQQMAEKDAQTHDFINVIKDQADYKDSTGQVVTIPYLYDHSWSDGKGNYILNTDPTFDPKGIQTPGTWEQMEQVVRGRN